VPQPKKKTAKKPTGPAKTTAHAPAKTSAKKTAKATGKRAAPVAAKAAPKPAPRKPKKPGTPAEALQPSLQSVVVAALEDMKALEIKVLDVRGLTDIADTMVIASGTSDRHVRSVAQRVVEKTKQAGFRPHGVEGQQDSDWVLIDLSDLIVHVMLPRVREFYGLEKLWDLTASKRAAARA
jgi:ribosome silencing factor RsfS/YbeB/iojap